MQVICPTWWIVAMHSKADCLTRRLAWIKLGEIAEQTCNKSNSWLGNFKSATMTKFTTSSLILAFFWDNSGNKISMTLWGVQTFIKIFITRIHSILICTLESRVKKIVFFPSSQTLRLWVLSQVETIITIALSIWFGTQKVCTWFCRCNFFQKTFYVVKNTSSEIINNLCFSLHKIFFEKNYNDKIKCKLPKSRFKWTGLICHIYLKT